MPPISNTKSVQIWCFLSLLVWYECSHVVFILHQIKLNKKSKIPKKVNNTSYDEYIQHCSYCAVPLKQNRQSLLHCIWEENDNNKSMLYYLDNKWGSEPRIRYLTHRDQYCRYRRVNHGRKRFFCYSNSAAIVCFYQFSTTLSFESSVGRGVLSLDFKYFTRSIERCPTTKSGRFSLGNFFVTLKRLLAALAW